MPIIAISADIYEPGLYVAKQVSEGLGFHFLGRELLARLADEHNLTEKDLLAAVNSPHGLLPRQTRRRRELINLVQAACLERLQDDDTVCYGLGAHLYLNGISHAMRVHMINDPEERAADLARKEGTPLNHAPELLRRREQSSHKWSLDNFGSNECEPALYDLGLNLTTLDRDKAVDFICEAAASRKFQAMTYSRKCMADKLLACQVRLKLLPRFPDADVTVSDGTVVARLDALPFGLRKKQEAIREIASGVEGVNYLEVHVNAKFLG